MSEWFALRPLHEPATRKREAVRRPPPDPEPDPESKPAPESAEDTPEDE
ncbi:hypothetical protein ACWCOV_31465 [Kribbella sp. NPDC002412]